MYRYLLIRLTKRIVFKAQSPRHLSAILFVEIYNYSSDYRSTFWKRSSSCYGSGKSSYCSSTDNCCGSDLAVEVGIAHIVAIVVKTMEIISLDGAVVVIISTKCLKRQTRQLKQQ